MKRFSTGFVTFCFLALFVSSVSILVITYDKVWTNIHAKDGTSATESPESEEIPSTFRVIKSLGKIDNTTQNVNILEDTETGIQYIWIHDAYNGGITPYLDKNGNVIKGNKQ